MRFSLFWLVIFPVLLFSDKGTIEEEKPKELVPWFTGPLVSPSSLVVGEGHYNLEPYFLVTKFPALYDNDWHARSAPTEWGIQLLAPIWVGLTDWCDILLNPTAFWSHKRGGGGAWALGDLRVQFDFQIWHEELPYKSWLPSIKLGIGEIVPIGKYRNLNPRKLGIDRGGFGTWATIVELVFGRTFHFNGAHFLSCRFSCDYAIYNSPVHVKGYNAYGGGVRANERVFPGRHLQLDMGFEYSLSRNWALALDIIGYWQDKTKFTGNPGTDFFLNTPAIVARNSAIEYSLAPAIEYNWSENLGVIAGAWFSVAGKQTSEFFTFAFAVDYYK